MGKRALIRLAAAAAGGALAFGVAGPALAQATVPLNQEDVFADDPDFDQGFGECTEMPDQDPDEDVWVFVWPGNVDAEDIKSLSLNFDSDGDDVADETFTLAEVTPTDDGTAMLVLVTPAGWMLVNGTSEVDPAPPGANPQFNLSHTCAAEADDGDDGDDDKDKKKDRDRRDRDHRDRGDRDRDRDDRDRDRDDDKDDQDDKGLPVTGGQLGGMALLGGGLLTAGLAMLAVRRRRNLSHLLEG